MIRSPFVRGALFAFATSSALAFADPSVLSAPEYRQIVIAGGALVTGVVDTNADLGQLSTNYTKRVTRLGFMTRGDSPPTDYIASTSPCVLNGGRGDGATQVKSADNRCWLALTASVAPAISTPFFDTARSNGWFAAGDNRAASAQMLTQAENQAGRGTTGFRDGFFIQHRDGDTTNYRTDGHQKVSNGLRVMTSGAYSAGAFQPQTKDLVGIDAQAIARIAGWDVRGVSGILAGAIQHGSGIASNEFVAENPPAGEQSKSMASVQAILRPHKADVDGTHAASPFIAQNAQGFLATAGIRVVSTPHPSIAARDGAFQYGLDLRPATATLAGIRMPACRAGGTAACTIIDYGSNNWTDLSAGTYRWILDGAVKLQVSSEGVAFNGNAPASKCALPAALPIDGSASSAAIARALNEIRSCLISTGLAR